MLEQQILNELKADCWRRPAKRQSLRLARLLLKERLSPDELVIARELSNELTARLARGVRP